MRVSKLRIGDGCAAVAGLAPFDNITFEEWNHHISVNLTGTSYACKPPLRTWQRRGGAAW